MRNITIGLLVLILFGSLIEFSDLAEQNENVELLKIEKRVADLEAYMNNASKVGSNISIGPAHNGWLMICSALVFFMTLPGLAVFYGGLVRQKNVLSVLAQCLGIAGFVTLLWWAFGYSLVFTRSTPLIGGFSKIFLHGVGAGPNSDYSPWVSESIFAMFQLMFAVITPALIIGSIAERMKFWAVIFFTILWMGLVYLPLAHMVWGADGMMNGLWNADAKIKAIDFAGGTVVHMSSGWSALILCILVGHRKGYGKEPLPPHNLVICLIGTGILWFGWYGFNAGSSLAADGIAASAFVATTLSAAAAALAWPVAEYFIKGKPSVLGFCSGVVAGLVIITPAAGFVSPSSAVIMGTIGGLVTFFGCYRLKLWFGYDDALDTFGIHGVGGTVGSILTGLFAAPEINANLLTNLKAYMGFGLIVEQIKAAGLTILFGIIGTLIAANVVKAFIDLRASEEDEVTGLDISEHGEEGYNI